jgi:hypothetical protein
MAVQEKILSISEVVDFLHPLPGPLFARLSIMGAAVSKEEFYRLRNDRWESPEYPPGRSPSMEDLIKANSWTRVQFSPWLNVTSVASAPAPFDNVVALFPLPFVEASRLAFPPPGGSENSMIAIQGRALEGQLRQARAEGTVIDPDAGELVCARLRALGELGPSLVIHEGDRISALWRLSERFTEPSIGHGYSAGQPVLGGTGVFANLLHRLAARLDGDRMEIARPSHLLLDTPGTRRQDIKLGRTPSPVVTAEVWSERLFSLDEIVALTTSSK